MFLRFTSCALNGPPFGIQDQNQSQSTTTYILQKMLQSREFCTMRWDNELQSRTQSIANYYAKTVCTGTTQPLFPQSFTKNIASNLQVYNAPRPQSASFTSLTSRVHVPHVLHVLHVPHAPYVPQQQCPASHVPNIVNVPRKAYIGVGKV